MVVELIFLVAVIFGVVWWYADQSQKLEKRRLRYKRADALNQAYYEGRKRNRLRTKSIKPKSPWLPKKKPPKADSAELRRLNALTRSEELSLRMIRHAAERNPGRSEQWCIEKAIYDIERDRMAR